MLAAGIGWSGYDKKKHRDKLLADMAAMDREAREKMILRLPPLMQKELRQQLMMRYGKF